jgi:MFS family permease
LFWTTLSGALFTLGCAVTTNFTTFYGLRALMGFTLTACQTIGLSFIKDMFYFHEHARKIGLWAALFLVAPYCGPLFGNFIIHGTGEWRNVFWLVFGICCLDLILILVWADETWYNRTIAPEQQPGRGSRLMRVLGVWQIQNHGTAGFMGWSRAIGRLTETLFKPIIIPTMLYYMMSFMWAVGINITTSILFETPRSLGGYGFKSLAVGFLYFTPVVAVSLGELFGHFFNDFLANRYISRHAGKFEPEVRLWANYLAALCMLPGLIVVGQGLHLHLHWVSLVMGWGIYVWGVMVASVATTAYLLDCYPNASGEVAGWLNFARVIGGFTVGYFQMPWGVKQGFNVSFGIQAAVVGIALILLASIQKFGKGLRVKGGPVKF